MQTQNLINLSLLLLSVKLKPSANKTLLDFCIADSDFIPGFSWDNKPHIYSWSDFYDKVALFKWHMKDILDLWFIIYISYIIPS